MRAVLLFIFTAMKKILTVFALVAVVSADAQVIHENYIAVKDSVRIGDKDYLPFTEKGYTLVLPENKAVQGVVVSLDGAKFDVHTATAAQLIHPAANAAGLAVLYLCTGNPVEFFFDKKSIDETDALLSIVFRQYNLPNKNVFLLGANLSGTRGLKYIEYCRKGKSAFNPDIKGIALFDCALDMVRMWNEGTKGIKDNVAESSVAEGKMVTYILKDQFTGKPHSFMKNYLDYSPYSYWDEENRNIPFYEKYAVRAYTEPDVQWWIEHKAKSYYETNAPDMAGIINELKLAGSKDAELIVFSAHREGRHNPDATFELVDKAELVRWMVQKSK